MDVYRVKHATKQLFAHQDAGDELRLPRVVTQAQNASIFTSEHWAGQVAETMTRNKGGKWIVQSDTAFENEDEKSRAFAGPWTIEETS